MQDGEEEDRTIEEEHWTMKDNYKGQDILMWWSQIWYIWSAYCRVRALCWSIFFDEIDILVSVRCIHCLRGMDGCVLGGNLSRFIEGTYINQ
jgi:hypothetical protein